MHVPRPGKRTASKLDMVTSRHTQAAHAAEYESDEAHEEGVNALQRVQDRGEALKEVTATLHLDTGASDEDWTGHSDGAEESLDSDAEEADVQGAEQDAQMDAKSAAWERRRDADMERQRKWAANRMFSHLERIIYPTVACTPPVPEPLPFPEEPLLQLGAAPPPLLARLLRGGLVQNGDYLAHQSAPGRTGVVRKGQLVDLDASDQVFTEPSALLSYWLGAVSAEEGELRVNGDLTLAQLAGKLA